MSAIFVVFLEDFYVILFFSSLKMNKKGAWLHYYMFSADVIIYFVAFSFKMRKNLSDTD